MDERAVELSHAREHLAELIRDAADGEPIVLTEDGTPVARLVPIGGRQGPREFGSARGLIRMEDDFDAPLDEFGEYM